MVWRGEVVYWGQWVYQGSVVSVLKVVCGDLADVQFGDAGVRGGVVGLDWLFR